MIDPARRVVEHDVDGSADLDGLKAVLGKHSDNCNLFLDDEGHCRAGLQRAIADRQRDIGHIAVGGGANCGLRQFPHGSFKLRLSLGDRGIDAADFGIHGELGALLRRLGDV